MENFTTDGGDLRERLAIIETMISEGRRTTAYWGPVILLWGIAFYVAFGWYVLGNHTPWAWPTTMMGTFLLTRVIHRSRRRGQPKTIVGQAIGSIWIAMILSMLVLFFAISRSHGSIAPNIQAAVLATMLGFSNAACGLLLKWKQQFACGVIWWATAVVACFGTARLVMIGFLTAAFFCWIVFGIYVTFQKSKTSPQGGIVHA